MVKNIVTELMSQTDYEWFKIIASLSKLKGPYKK